MTWQTVIRKCGISAILLLFLAAELLGLRIVTWFDEKRDERMWTRLRLEQWERLKKEELKGLT